MCHWIFFFSEQFQVQKSSWSTSELSSSSHKGNIQRHNMKRGHRGETEADCSMTAPTNPAPHLLPGW